MFTPACGLRALFHLIRVTQERATARGCFAGGRRGESGRLRSKCKWLSLVYRVLQFTGRAELRTDFHARAENARNSHRAEILGALAKAPPLNEIWTQAERQ